MLPTTHACVTCFSKLLLRHRESRTIGLEAELQAFGAGVYSRYFVCVRRRHGSFAPSGGEWRLLGLNVVLEIEVPTERLTCEQAEASRQHASTKSIYIMIGVRGGLGHQKPVDSLRLQTRTSKYSACSQQK